MSEDPKVEPRQYIVAVAGNLPGKWLCPNGHVIGTILQERRSGRNVNRLLVFTGALLPESPVPTQAGRCKMDAGEVICGICGATREWHPGEYLMQKLLEGRKR